MEIRINIEKRHFFVILGVVLILVGAYIVYAVVPNPGHSTDQIDWDQQIPGPIKQDMDANYDVWIQGGASTAAGPNRNLAILGIKGTSEGSNILRLNYNNEYGGGTRVDGNIGIGGDPTSNRLYVAGNLQVNGDLISNSNTRSNCAWEQTSTSLERISCPDEKYMAGIELGFGFSPTFINCCEL